MDYRHINVRPCSGNAGAFVSGVDLSQPLGAEVATELRRAWLAHTVLFFRNQQLSPQAQLDFARRFGPAMERLSFVKTLPGFDDVQVTGTNPARRPELFIDWHTDATWKALPTLGTVLYCVETPEGCGDTLWSNQCAAWDGLSPALQERLLGLTAVHDPLKPQARFLPDSGALASLATARESMPTVEHPLVTRHPETGRSILYANPLFTSYIKELARAESNALLAFLFTHCERLEFQCRLQWEPGTVAFWDNRCTMHKVIDDYWPRPRRMHRIGIECTEAPRY